MLNKIKMFKICKLNDRRMGRKAAMALVAAVCLALVSSACWAAPKEQKMMTDKQIANAVDQMLLSDSEMVNHMIDVKVNDGIVTLSGTVNQLMAKERAVKIAETIRGVRGVVNTIELKVSSRTDKEISKDVKAALLYDAATSSFNIEPSVKEGVVTLNGAVQSFREKRIAMHDTERVKGVRDVRDNISIKNTGKRTDAEIANDVKRAIAISVWLEPNFINTNVKDGVVTLTGEVGTPAQNDLAVLLAMTAGVKSVNAEGLKVEPWARARGQRKEIVTFKDDSQIKQAVLDAFVFDPRVFSFGPGVDVENGAVTLSGIVNNLKAKRAAEQDAKNTVGVWRVKNLLKIRPAKPVPDIELAQNVFSAILLDSALENYDIEVKAKNGVITLSGNVDSNYEKAQADDIASLANGAMNVKNNIKVNSPSLDYYDLSYDPDWGYTPSYYWNEYQPYHPNRWNYISDAETEANIKEDMFWSPWVNLDDITVKVANGVATLTGAVTGWFEYNKLTDYAYQGGASRVYNNVTVR